MSQTSHILSLPYIQPAQAQKHVTHNEALRILDAVTQLSVISTTLTAPPAQSAPGDRYIVGDPATQGWAGQEQNVAVWVDSTWQFFAPSLGWRADIAGTGEEVRFDGTVWQPTSGTVNLQNIPAVGVNTTADNTNKLAVAAQAEQGGHRRYGKPAVPDGFFGAGRNGDGRIGRFRDQGQRRWQHLSHRDAH